MHKNAIIPMPNSILNWWILCSQAGVMAKEGEEGNLYARMLEYTC